MADGSLRLEIVRFARSFHSEHGSVPSVGVIVKHFGLNKARFYRLFSSLAELCRAAEVPIPEERIESVRAALESRSVHKEQAATVSQECLTLSPQATMRIYGICELEGGIEPAVAIDMLLNYDYRLRRHYHLTLAKTRQISNFLDTATSRGWTIESLVDYLVKVWNSGILNRDQTWLSNLISLVQGINIQYWGSVESFIRYATMHSSVIGYYRAYLGGGISLAKLLEVEGFL